MISTRRIIVSVNKIVALNLRRKIQTTQVLALRVTGSKLRRMGTRLQSPFIPRKLIKDSELVDVNDEHGEDNTNPSPNLLELAYEDQIREFKDETKKINKIIMKKSFVKRPKEPNMLTFNERQHIRFLHKSDPIEWSPEHLSESFPALPRTIRSILKNKWVPDNEEKMKAMDDNVLQNWNKLKENKLEASKELLEHLKKFIDKRENLELQLKNPNFFHLPQMKKKVIWRSGDLNSFLLKYEREVNELGENHANAKSLIESTKEGNKYALVHSDNAVEKGMESVHVNENKNFEGRSLYLEEGPKVNLQFAERKSRKQMTLQELKKRIFEKADNANDFISPEEEAVIQKMLNKREQSEYDSDRRKISSTSNESKPPATNSTSSNVTGDDSLAAPGDLSATLRSRRGRGGRRTRTLLAEKGNLHEKMNEHQVYSNTLEVSELGQKLFGVRDEGGQTEAVVTDGGEEKNVDAPRVKITGNKTASTVNHFNTEKDKQIYEKHEKLLSETVFWNTKKRSRSLDSGFASVNTAANPHVASHLQTYFTYDYPLKIEIPQDKREKGKLYRVKDCYYDDNGVFLYRVPGMTE